MQLTLSVISFKYEKIFKLIMYILFNASYITVNVLFSSYPGIQVTSESPIDRQKGYTTLLFFSKQGQQGFWLSHLP